MAKGRITYSSLASKARDNLIYLIDNSSNVADPITSSSEHRRWIYSRSPDVKSNEFTGYPYIVIHPSDTDVPNERRSLDGKSSKIYWTLDIDISSSDRGHGETDAQGLNYMEAISDDVLETIMNVTNRKTLRSYGMYSSTPTTSAVIPVRIHNELVFKRSISLMYSGKLQVSS